MKVYSHSDTQSQASRAHPWTHALSDSTQKYYDFKSNPKPIRSSLEDFVPLSHWNAIDRFYELLEWLNGKESVLESNDCGTDGLRPNKNLNVRKTIECTARLMVLYRHLPNNLPRGTVQWLEAVMHHYLRSVDPSFELGVVGTTLMPVHYITLPLPEPEQAGFQLMLSFWAWGDTDSEVMENLDRTFSNTHWALTEVSREIVESSARLTQTP